MFIQSRKRKARNILIGAIGFMLLLLVACITGYNYSRARMKEESRQEKATETEYPSINIPISTPTPRPTPSEGELYDAALAQKDDVLAANARLDIVYEYYLCEHSHVITVTEGLAGKTSEQLELDYSGEVLEFTPSHAKVKVSYNMYCPDHYILRSENGKLQILKSVLGKNELEVDREIESIILPPDEELEKGIVFDSLEAIELYLENIES